MRRTWRAGRWQTPADEPREPDKGGSWAFLDPFGSTPAERPPTFTVVDENGVEHEVFAPPGHVARQP
jgi:hypothetical protein